MPMLYRIFASLKTSVCILVILCFLYLIGTIFPQNVSLDEYIKAGGRYVGLVKALNLLDLFVSPVFIVVTLVLLVNLIVCLLDRAGTLIKMKRRPMDFHSLKNHPQTVTFSNGHLIKRLEAIGFKLKAKREGAQEPGVMVFEKGLPYWWLSWFYHAGIIIAIVGFFITALFAFESDVILYPDEPVNISLDEAETRWDRLLEKIGIERKKAQGDTYELILRDFRTEYYQGLEIDYPSDKLERMAIGLGLRDLKPSSRGFGYMPKMWATVVGIKRPDGHEEDVIIKVNEPFRSGWLTLYQMGFIQEIDILIDGNEKKVESGTPFKVEGLEGRLVIGTVRTGTLYKKDGSIQEIHPVASVYYLPDSDRSKKKFLGEIKMGESITVMGKTIEFRDFREGSYLSYRIDPGVGVVGVASIFVFIGLTLRCFGAWYRVQYAHEKKIAYVLVSSRGILADKHRIIKRLG